MADTHALSRKEVQEQRKELEKAIEEAQTRLAQLQQTCTHPKKDNHNYLGRVGYGLCPDCGKTF